MRHHNKTQEGKKSMSAARKLESSTHVISILKNLNQQAAISEKEVLGYLDISEKTLTNWKSDKSEAPTKAKRLFRLNETVECAVDFEIPKNQIKQILTAPVPVTSEEVEPASLLTAIQGEPENALLGALIRMVVERFSNQLKELSGSEIRLSRDEFANLLKNIEKPEDPSKNLQSARQRYLKSRIV